MVMQPVQVTQKYIGLDNDGKLKFMLLLNRLSDDFVYKVCIEGEHIRSEILTALLQKVFHCRSFEQVIGQRCHLRMDEDENYEIGNTSSDFWTPVVRLD